MGPSAEISLLRPLAVGTAITLLTVIIHGITLAAIVAVVRRDLRRGLIGSRFSINLIFVAGAMLILFVAHLIEIALWALVNCFFGEFSSFAMAFYYSAGNYTTIGSGSLTMSGRWKLLAPLEATDGMLMFGITTAMIFSVIQHLVHHRYRDSVTTDIYI